MIELVAAKKNKVSLTDYDYKRDIENRLLLSQLTSHEYALLEEILFSPIRTSVRKIAKNVDMPEDEALPTLQKLAKTGLISFEDDAIVVDKEMRKYFETEIEKFDEGFEPGMEFLQQLLKKVPIHVLPLWYAIPRTSNNIFESLIEKYLLTPHTFQRYLLDLNFPDPTLTAIAQDLFKAPHFEMTTEEIRKKYRLSAEQVQEAMLNLEFHFICTFVYRKHGNKWQEVVTPFHEWKEYLIFLKETTPTSISDPKKIQRYRPGDFAFVDDITAILAHAKKEPTFLDQKNGSIKLAASAPDEHYIKRLILKIEQVELARLDGRKFALSEAGLEWLDLRSENKALYLYRHPSSMNEKIIREVEKSILRILHSGWVRFSDFMRGVYVPIREGQAVALHKTGKHWKYQRPAYTPEECALIQTVVLEHLFEAGITALGSFENEMCLSVTPFGQSLFG